MKIQLTHEWDKKPNSFIFQARSQNVFLECRPCWPDTFHIKYQGRVFMINQGCVVFSRNGKYHDRPERAKKEAERLAVELILDIVCGAEELKKQHSVTEDD